MSWLTLAVSGSSAAEARGAAATREHLPARPVLLLQCNTSLLRWGTRSAHRSWHTGAAAGQALALPCKGKGRAAGSQQEEKRLALTLRADLIDTDLFPHGKVIENSAPWGWCWDSFPLGLPVTAGK